MRYSSRLRFFAGRYLRDPVVAEDAAQEALRRTLEALRAGKVADPEALPSFAYQTVLHICIHRWRASAREGRARELLGRTPPDGGPDPTAELLSRERAEQVRHALAALRPEDRDLLRAIYYEEEDPKTLAERFGITGGALRVRRHRALKCLGDLLGGAGA